MSVPEIRWQQQRQKQDKITDTATEIRYQPQIKKKRREDNSPIQN